MRIALGTLAENASYITVLPLGAWDFVMDDDKGDVPGSIELLAFGAGVQFNLSLPLTD